MQLGQVLDRDGLWQNGSTDPVLWWAASSLHDESSREALWAFPLAGGAIRHHFILQHERRTGLHRAGGLKHETNFTGDEWSHLRPGDAVHPHRIDAVRDGNPVRVGDERAAVNLVGDLVNGQNQMPASMRTIWGKVTCSGWDRCAAFLKSRLL